MSSSETLAESNVLRVTPDLFKHKITEVGVKCSKNVYALCEQYGYEDAEYHRLLANLLMKLTMTCGAELNSIELEAGGEDGAVAAVRLGTSELSSIDQFKHSISLDIANKFSMLLELTSIKEILERLGDPFPSDPSVFTSSKSTKNQLDALKTFKQKLISMEMLRKGHIMKLLEECRQLIESMNLVVEGFETLTETAGYETCDKKLLRFMQEGVNVFSVHNAHVAELKSRKESLQEEARRRAQKCDKTEKSIQALWEALSLPQEERDGFTESLVRNLSTTYVSSLLFEEERLETIRRKQISTAAAEITQLAEELGEAGALSETAALSGVLTIHAENDPHTQIAQLQEFKQELLLAREKRQGEIKSILDDCIELVMEMDLQNEGFQSLPDAVLLKDTDRKLLEYMRTGQVQFATTQADVDILRRRLGGLMEEKMQRHEHLHKVWLEVHRLWQFLHISAAEKTDFMDQLSVRPKLCKQALELSQAENERLRLVYSTNHATVVDSTRKEILRLWKDAGMTEESIQKAEFPEFFDEELATEHFHNKSSQARAYEAYCAKLLQKLTDPLSKPIMTKIALREQVVKERMQLETVIQKAPERLVGRSFVPLEEKKREETIIARVANLDELTIALMDLIETWEGKTQEKFLYGQEPYLDRIQRQEEEYDAVKTAMRDERKGNRLGLGKGRSHSGGTHKVFWG